MKKIKIVNIVSRMIFGGVESVIYNYYSNMDLSKFELYIITKKDYKPEAVEKFKKIGFNFIFIDDWEKEPKKVKSQLLEIFDKNKFDIIHSHLSHTNFYFMYLAYIAKIPIRISHSHLSVKDKSIKDKIKHFLYKRLIWMFATDFVACGKEAAKNLYNSKKNVVIFNNAIDMEKYVYNDVTRKEYREKLEISSNSLCLGTIGRMTYQKNQEYLIDIFANIKNQNKDSKLIIIGDGENKEKLLSKILKMNLQDDVILLGNRNDVAQLLNVFDIFVLPSLYEGLPVVGIEAQASGLKCFFSNNIDETVKLSDNCFFLSIEENPEIWSNFILKESAYNREKMNDVITKSGFNIRTEGKRMEKYYLSLYDRSCNNEKNGNY